MCLAVPVQIKEIMGDDTALADFGGLQKKVRLDLVDARVGDYVLVHVGFALDSPYRPWTRKKPLRPGAY